MSIVVTVLHVVACFVLIVVVLLQTGKGADIGAVFGGSSQTIFGSGGAGNLLTKLTTWTAVVFMLTSLFLTWSSTRGLTSSIADTIPEEPPPLVAPLEGDLTPVVPGAGAEGETAAPAEGETADAGAAATAGETAPAAGAGGTAAGAAAEESSAAETGAGDGTAPAGGAAPAAEAPAAPPADAASGGTAGGAGADDAASGAKGDAGATSADRPAAPAQP